MDLTVTENRPDALAFTLHNADSSFANALRRIMLSEIPTLAIDEVTVRVNTSVTKDEMLVHRLGLVPITSEAANEMNFPWVCPCSERGGGCSRCTVEMELSVRCAMGEAIKQITTRDISIIAGPLSHRVFPVMAADKQGKGIWLTSLGPGQEISMYCKVHKGIAKQHAKWMPVSAVTMQYEADIRLDDAALAKLTPEEQQKFVQVCPVKVFGLNDATIFVKDPEKCIFCDDCVRPEGLPENMVRVRPKSTSRNRYTYRFRIETVGSLAPEKVVRDALSITRSKLLLVDAHLCGKDSLSYTQQSHMPGISLVGKEAEEDAEGAMSSFAETEVMSVQFFSTNRFKPKNVYSVNHENYMNGLACFPEDAYLQKHSTPMESEANTWKSQLLVVKDGKVYGTYRPPSVHPFPQSFAPEGISIEDYKNYINMHDTHVFAFVLSRHAAICGFLKKDATWVSTPWLRNIERNFKESQMRTTRNSSIFIDVCEFLRSHESRLEECPTLWYRVSPNHGILIPVSGPNKRIRAEDQFGAARWHEEDEREARSMPLGGDPRWTPMPSCAWPDIMYPDGVRRVMNSGLVEVA